MAEIEREGDDPLAPATPLRAPRHWPIARKLWTGFGLIALVLAANGIASYRYIQQVDSALIRVVVVERSLDEAVLEMGLNAERNLQAVQDYVWDPNPEHLESIRRSRYGFQNSAANFNLLAETEDQRRLGRQVTSLHGKFSVLGAEIINLAEQRQATGEDPSLGLSDKLKKHLQEHEEILTRIDQVLERDIRPLIHAETILAAEAAKSSTDKAILLFLVLGVLALVLGGVAAWSISRGILRPIRVLVNSAETLGDGTLPQQIDIKSEDEFGRLARAFNCLIERRAQGLKTAEAARLDLERNQNRLAAILDTAAEGIITISENGIITSFNRMATIMFGYSEDELVGQNVTVLMPDPYHDEHDSYLANYRETGIRKLIGVGADVIGKRKDGTIFPLELAVSEMQLGRALAFTGIVRDITARKRVDEALRKARDELELRVQERTAELKTTNEELRQEVTQRERAQAALTSSEARFKGFAESASDWFWEIDADQRFTYVSGRFFEVFGLPLEAVIGKKWEDLVGAPQIAAEWTKWRHHFDDLETHRPIRDFDYAIVGADQVKRQIRVSGLPMFDDAGKFLGYRGSGADVTAQQRIEEELRQAQKLEALGRLSGGIAHDFNNILLPIITITEVTRDDLGQDKRMTANLDKVLMAAQRGRSLVEKILKFSRRQPMDRRPVDLAEVVVEALELVSAAVPATIEVRSDFEPGLGKVLADGTQIHEVVMNLTSNAAQSIGMKKGIIETTLREVRIEDSDFDKLADLAPGPYARLTVSDTGSGMDADTMAQIFDPFFTTKAVGEGTGLGLAAVHGIVTEHGGAITVSSEPERGTTFEIYLPLLEAGEARSDDTAIQWPLTGS